MLSIAHCFMSKFETNKKKGKYCNFMELNDYKRKNIQLYPIYENTVQYYNSSIEVTTFLYKSKNLWQWKL